MSTVLPQPTPQAYGQGIHLLATNLRTSCTTTRAHDRTYAYPGILIQTTHAPLDQLLSQPPFHHPICRHMRPTPLFYSVHLHSHSRQVEEQHRPAIFLRPVPPCHSHHPTPHPHHVGSMGSMGSTHHIHVDLHIGPGRHGPGRLVGAQHCPHKVAARPQQPHVLNQHAHPCGTQLPPKNLFRPHV